jgi:hypothetical protein
MNYTKYPDAKDTPSRKARKGLRTKIFMDNYGLAAKKRHEKKVAKRAAEEALENTEE